MPQPGEHGSDEEIALDATVSAPVRALPDAAHVEPAVGDLLGNRYELVEELGRGGFGVVFRAHDRVAAEAVAVKVFSREHRSADEIARMRAELRAARRIADRRVVRIHDLVEAGDYLVLSMELVEGETLQRRLRDRPMRADEWIRLARDLAHALFAAHQAGVVHRDLKPANVLLRSGGGAVITDFGVSQLAAATAEATTAAPAEGSALHLTREGTVVGTPLYMAPEQLSGDRVGPAADLYALGVVLYGAATGELPRRGDTVGQLAASHREPAPRVGARRPDLPDPAATVVDRLLAIDPDRRPDVRAVLDALEPTSRSRSQTRRVWLIGVLVAAAAIGIAVTWARGRGRPSVAPSSLTIPRIAIEVREAPSPGFAGAVEDLARERWSLDRRLEVVADPARANVVLELAVATSGAQVAVRAHAQRSERRIEVTASSASDALDAVADRLARTLGATARRSPNAEERSAMAVLGAPSFDALLAYRGAERAWLAADDVDEPAVTTVMDELIRQDPAWVRPYALLVTLQGISTDTAQATARRARQHGDPARDPAGWRIIGASEEATRGRLDDRVFAVDPTDNDPLEGNLRMIFLEGADRTEEAIAVARQLYERYPHMMFGTGLTRYLDAVGRGDEVPALVRAWLAAAPSGEAALLAAARLAIDEGDVAAAERHVRDLVVLHGDTWYRQVLLANVLIVAGRLGEARVQADRLLSATPLARARGLYRQGIIATLEGRFAAAHELLGAALVANRPFGYRSETTQVLDALVSIEPRADDKARLLEELADAYARTGVATPAAIARYELALHRRRAGRACPAIDSFLQGLDDRQRGRARLDMLRHAAGAGCARCDAVVHQGLAARETSARATLAFGRCAIRSGELDLAEQAFHRLQRGLFFNGSGIEAPFERMLARFELGRIAEKRGHRDAARRLYRAFLDGWRGADRRIPEVVAAEAALARLGR